MCAARRQPTLGSSEPGKRIQAQEPAHAGLLAPGWLAQPERKIGGLARRGAPRGSSLGLGPPPPAAAEGRDQERVLLGRELACQSRSPASKLAGVPLWVGRLSRHRAACGAPSPPAPLPRRG